MFDLDLLKLAMRKDKSLFQSNIRATGALAANTEIFPPNNRRFAIVIECPNIATLANSDVTVRVTSGKTTQNAQFTILSGGVAAGQAQLEYHPIRLSIFDLGDLIWGRWTVQTNSNADFISAVEVLLGE